MTVWREEILTRSLFRVAQQSAEQQDASAISATLEILVDFAFKKRIALQAVSSKVSKDVKYIQTKHWCAELSNVKKDIPAQLYLERQNAKPETLHQKKMTMIMKLNARKTKHSMDAAAVNQLVRMKTP